MNDAEILVRDFLNLLAVPDTKAAVELLHPDVEWRNTGLPTLRGRRVGGALLDLERRGIGVVIDLHHAAASGDVVLTDRTDHITYKRYRTSFWVRGTFRVEGRPDRALGRRLRVGQLPRRIGGGARSSARTALTTSRQTP